MLNTNISITPIDQLEPYVYKIVELGSKDKEGLPYKDVSLTYKLEKEYPKFNTPSKIYGRYQDDTLHMFNYFQRQDKSVGVLLTGDTGSGKSLTCKLMCNLAIEQGYPVIITEGMAITDDVVKFLSTLDNCVIFLDEFGKLTKNETQSVMLQMLTNNNKRILWLFANKNKYQIHEEFFNRPERIRYNINYTKIEKDVIVEYCRDQHVPEDFIQNILAKYSVIKDFSFDQLQGLVSEHNYAPWLSVDEIGRLLNFKGLKTMFKFDIDNAEYTGTNLYLLENIDIKFNGINEDNFFINRMKDDRRPGTFSIEEYTAMSKDKALFERSTSISAKVVHRNFTDREIVLFTQFADRDIRDYPNHMVLKDIELVNGVIKLTYLVTIDMKDEGRLVILLDRKPIED